MVLDNPRRLSIARIANEPSESFDDWQIGFTASVLFDALSDSDPDVGLRGVEKRSYQGRFADPQFPRDEDGLSCPSTRVVEMGVQPTYLLPPAHDDGLDFIPWRFLPVVRLVPAGLPGVDFTCEGVDRSQRPMPLPIAPRTLPSRSILRN